MGDSDSRRKLWQKREEQGCCIYCGKNSPNHGVKGCSSCLDKKIKKTVEFSKRRPEKQIRYRYLTRKEAIEKYGGRCVCCDETRILFLTLDHINNDGGKERKLFSGYNVSSTGWYLKVIKEPIRNDLQVLCYNCNMGRACNDGICPHHGLSSKFDILKTNIDERKIKRFNKGTKIDWPTDTDLVAAVNANGYAALAKEYGVHKTAIRSRLKRRNLLQFINNATSNKRSVS